MRGMPNTLSHPLREQSIAAKRPMTPTPSKGVCRIGSLPRDFEVVEFASEVPAFAGEMRITVSFADTAGGTEVTM